MEYITANGTQYECQNVSTNTKALTFTLSGMEIADAISTFKNVTEIAVSDGTNVYGTYPNLAFKSATVFADGTIEIAMRILSETEVRLVALEATQAEHDELIAEMLWG